MWIYCEGPPPPGFEGTKCGKRLIKRLPGGLYEFRFGAKSDKDERPPVVMLIQGSVKMNCLRRECNHETILNQFPLVEDPRKKR